MYFLGQTHRLHEKCWPCGNDLDTRRLQPAALVFSSTCVHLAWSWNFVIISQRCFRFDTAFRVCLFVVWLLWLLSFILQVYLLGLLYPPRVHLLGHFIGWVVIFNLWKVRKQSFLSPGKQQNWDGCNMGTKLHIGLNIYKSVILSVDIS